MVKGSNITGKSSNVIAKVDENIAYCSKLQGGEVNITDNEAYGTGSKTTIII